MKTGQQNQKPKMGNFVPYVLRNHKKFMPQKRKLGDKRCFGQYKINYELRQRAMYAANHNGVYPLTQQEIEGEKLRMEMDAI